MTESVRPQILPYRDPDDPSIRGMAVAGFGDLKLSTLPWHLKRGQTDEAYTCVKSSRRRRVIRLERDMGGSEPTVLLAKRYLSRSFINAAVHRLWPSKAKSEWNIGWKAMERGILTGRPVLMAEQVKGGLLRACHLVTEHIHAERTLRDQLKLMGQRGEEPTPLMESLADHIKSLHALSFYHDDLRADHLWVDTRGDAIRFGVIDLDQSSFRPVFTQERRVMNLFQVLSSIPPDLLGREARLHFLRCFGGDGTVDRVLAQARRKGHSVHLD